MIPLVSTVEELRRSKAYVVKEIDAVFAEAGVKIHYKIGTMIELPRAR